MKETEQTEIELEGIDPDIMDTILHYVWVYFFGTTCVTFIVNEIMTNTQTSPHSHILIVHNKRLFTC